MPSGHSMMLARPTTCWSSGWRATPRSRETPTSPADGHRPQPAPLTRPPSRAVAVPGIAASRGQAVRVTETHGEILRRWLLTAVRDLGGAAPRKQVHTRVDELFGRDFTTEDLAPRVGRGGEPAWRNNLDSLYDRL